jgi:hypothetical protein
LCLPRSPCPASTHRGLGTCPVVGVALTFEEIVNGAFLVRAIRLLLLVGLLGAFVLPGKLRLDVGKAQLWASDDDAVLPNDGLRLTIVKGVAAVERTGERRLTRQAGGALEGRTRALIHEVRVAIRIGDRLALRGGVERNVGSTGAWRDCLAGERPCRHFQFARNEGLSVRCTCGVGYALGPQPIAMLAGKCRRRQNHIQEKRDRKIYCDDFTDQKEAIEWLGQHPEDADHIDPDGDGIACEELDPVTCNDFSSQDEAQTWFNKYEPTFTAVDPFNLDPDNDGKACDITCADFNNQRDAVEWIAQHPGDRDELDPDLDGAACEHLEPVRCSDFDDQVEAQEWVALVGFFTPANDPYNLFKNADLTPCTNLPPP